MSVRFSQNFLRAFHDVKDRERVDEELKLRKEDRAIQRQDFKMRSDRLKMQDMEDARAARLKEVEAMEKLPGPPMVGPTETGEALQGQHPEMTIPAGGYGAPPMTIRPRTAQEVQAQDLAKHIQQKRAEVGIRPRINVQDSVAEKVGVPAGDYDTEELDLLEGSLDREGQDRRAAAQNKTTLAAAALRGTETSELDQKRWATMLSTGEAKLAQVPLRERTKVVNKMFGMNLAILTPQMESKLDQFHEASQALSKIEEDLAGLREAKTAAEKLEWATQLNADVNGLSRTVGRSLGEKGVFTDADKKDFASIVGFGAGLMPGGAAVGALFAPDAADARLKKLQDFMEKVKTERIKSFSKRTGGRMPAGMEEDNDPAGLFQ